MIPELLLETWKVPYIESIQVRVAASAKSSTTNNPIPGPCARFLRRRARGLRYLTAMRQSEAYINCSTVVK